MKEYGIAAELVLDLLHRFLHRGSAYGLDLHLDSHHPKDLYFNILFNFRMGKDDESGNRALDKIAEIGTHGRARENNGLIPLIRELVELFLQNREQFLHRVRIEADI